MTKAQPENPHHHGNLKEALVVAGIEILTEAGLPALTLRRCAAHAGVSHAAPAHHFDGLKGLLTAIAERGFKKFADCMNDASKHVTDPYARLLGICHGYLDFSRNNEALSALMFMTDRLDTSSESFQRHSSYSYQILAAACAPFSADSTEQRNLETLIWSLVQGYAGLSRTGQVQANNAEFDAMFALIKLRPNPNLSQSA